MTAVCSLSRIVLICDAPSELAHFYGEALGFTRCGQHTIEESAFGEFLGIRDASAQVTTLSLADQRVDLVRIEPAGRGYPDGVLGPSALFQHFAIEVTDLPAAIARLDAHPTWTPISIGGPQILPPSSGGVTAFKFRDPEGHPLELITPAAARAEGGRPRITHSAISVESASRSISFYEGLGLVRTGGSMNIGPEQDRLDGLRGARVSVTALSTPASGALHLELLCYEDRFERPALALQANDIAATRLVFSLRSETDLRALLRRIRADHEPTRFADGSLHILVRDPDGHCLCLDAPSGRA